MIHSIAIMSFVFLSWWYIQSCSEYNFHLCLHFIIMLKYRAASCVNLLPLIPFFALVRPVE